MNKFEEKTEEILDFLSMIPKNANTIKEFETELISGKSIVNGIINNDQVSIALWTVHDNSESHWHLHEETEYFILYKGNGYIMEYIDKDGKHHDVPVNKEKSCYILPNTPHKLKSTDGICKSIIVLIPGSNTFPMGA